MDGIAATRAIRRLDPAACIIIVTEHGDEAHRLAATAAGAHAFLMKENLLELPGMLGRV
jgi:DNA-binding NarL/FixJ family response regulator